jgi:hypothetical protein
MADEQKLFEQLNNAGQPAFAGVLEQPGHFDPSQILNPMPGTPGMAAPAAMMGPKPLTPRAAPRTSLQREEVQPFKSASGVPMAYHRFDILSPQGGRVGTVEAKYDQADPTNVHIEFIGATGAGGQFRGWGVPGSVGMTGTRNLLRDLKDNFPDMKSITGVRVTGARHGSEPGGGDEGTFVKMPVSELTDESLMQMLGGMG